MRSRSAPLPLPALALLGVACMALVACKHDPNGATPSASSSSASGVSGVTSAPSMGSSGPGASSDGPQIDREGIAKTWILAMANGNSANGTPSMLSADMKKAFTPEQANLVWAHTIKGAGAFKSLESVTTERALEGHQRVVVNLRYEAGVVTAWVTFDSKNEVVGFKTSPFDRWTPPPYVKEGAFDERPIGIGHGRAALPGVIDLPKGATNAPLVILVHGSGSGDRDETSGGGAKPFRDLGRGMASSGVAVMRYEKRTYGHYDALGLPADQITLKEEYFDDVDAAVKLAAKAPGVDAKRIYVLGHSEGGWLVPRFLKDHPELAGGIILSGPTRDLVDLVMAQYEHLAKSDPSPEAAKAMQELRVKVAKSKAPDLSPTARAVDLPFEIPAKYILSMRGYDAVATAKAIPQPLLILQGSRDYQVTPETDFKAWKQGLAGKANAKFDLYEGLNHLYFHGEGPILPKEYETAFGTVDSKVIADIVAFVTGK